MGMHLAAVPNLDNISYGLFHEADNATITFVKVKVKGKVVPVL
jgi:hypothetical protein